MNSEVTSFVYIFTAGTGRKISSGKKQKWLGGSKDVWSKSSYYNSLTNDDKTSYKNKLLLTNGVHLPDPYMLLDDWESNVALLPDVTFGDLFNYLINTPSEYTQESLKALKAYNFYVSGHVQDVFYNKISDESEFCFIKSEVTIYHILLLD